MAHELLTVTDTIAGVVLFVLWTVLLKVPLCHDIAFFALVGCPLSIPTSRLSSFQFYFLL
jgi:hypothetical protein